MTEINGQEAVLTADQKFYMPSKCCRCGQPGTKQRNSSVPVIGLGRRTRSVTFPYCDACNARAGKISSSRTLLVLMTLALALGVSMIGFAVPALGTIVVLVVPVLLATFAAFVLTARAGDTIEAPNGAWLARATAKTTTFFMSNEEWAKEFAAGNQLPTMKPTKRTERFLVWPWMFVVSLITAGIVAAVTHPDVYVDNEGPAPLQIWIDGKKSIVAKPTTEKIGKRASVSVPFGTHKFGYSPEGASAPVAETPPTKIEVAGDHLYNPGSTACYFLDVTVYGTDTGKGVNAGPVPLSELYTFGKVDNWFSENPSSVSTKASGETRVSLKPFDVCKEYLDCAPQVRSDLMSCLKKAYDAGEDKSSFKGCFMTANTACGPKK